MSRTPEERIGDHEEQLRQERFAGGWHQPPIIDSLAELLDGSAPSPTANIVFIELDENGVIDPLAALLALAAHGISPFEAIQIMEAFTIMTSPLFLAKSTMTDRYAAGRADTSLYGSFDGTDELPYGDIYNTADVLGIPLPVRYVDEDPDATGPYTLAPVTRPGGVSFIASQVNDQSRGVFAQLSEHHRTRREAKLMQMRGGKTFHPRHQLDSGAINRMTARYDDFVDDPQGMQFDPELLDPRTGRETTRRRAHLRLVGDNDNPIGFSTAYYIRQLVQRQAALAAFIAQGNIQEAIANTDGTSEQDPEGPFDPAS